MHVYVYIHMYRVYRVCIRWLWNRTGDRTFTLCDEISCPELLNKMSNDKVELRSGASHTFAG